VPLLRDSEVIGVISLTRKRVEPYTERQIELVCTFADQALIAIENARLLGELQARTRDLQESLEYQTATSDVLNVISRSTSDVQPVLDTVVETAVRLCGADYGNIAIREGGVYRFVSTNWVGAADPEHWAILRQRTIVPGRDSVAAQTALEGRVVHVADVRALSDYALPEIVASGLRTGLGVPLLREGAVLGVIGLGRNRVQPYTERQIELVRTFADQAVIAMENARLLGELQARTRDLEESLEYQTATSEVLNVISRSTADVQPVLDTVVETAARLCGADIASIAIREGEAYRFVASTFGAAEPEYWAIQRQRTVVPGRESIAGRAALEGRVVQIADVLADPDYAAPESVAAGLRTSLGVPLLREGVVLGTIGLGRKRVQPYTERQIELVRTFADQAVIAMENARLLGELQARTRDLEESLEYQTATSDVLKVISRSTSDVQPVLDTVAETAVRLCGADTGGIAIREDEVYRYVAQTQAAAADTEHWESLRQQTIVPGRDSVAGRVATEGRVVHVEDIRADPDYALPSAVASGRRTMLGVPLLRNGEPIGVIVLSRKRVEPFTDRQIELVRTLPTRPSLRWKTRGCSANCRSARATSKNRSNTRPRPATCSR
jgi:GAF domain-containing protein